MKKNFAIKGAIGLVVLGVLATVGTGGGPLSFGLLADDDPPATEETDNPGNGKLAADDLNADEPGWSDVMAPPGQETRETKGKPRLSELDFATEFVCYRLPEELTEEEVATLTPEEIEAVLVAEVIEFAPDAGDSSFRGAFRRKAAVPGGSKLLAQHVAVYQNEGGGGETGKERAQAALEELRAILEDPGCQRLEVRSQDPPDPQDPEAEPQVRVWDVVKQEDPELGDDPEPVPGAAKNALHFRAITTIGSTEGVEPGTEPPGEIAEVTIENDFIVIQRGRTLILMVETSPGGYENAEEEAIAHAGKADAKMSNQGGQGGGGGGGA